MKSNNQVDRFIKSSILLCRLYADTAYSSFDKKYFYLDFIEYQPKGEEYLEANFTIRFRFHKLRRIIDWNAHIQSFRAHMYLPEFTLVDSRKWYYQLHGKLLPFFDLKNLPRVIDEYFKSQNDIIANMDDVMISYHKIRKQAFEYIKMFCNNKESFSPIANYIINNRYEKASRKEFTSTVSNSV